MTVVTPEHDKLTAELNEKRGDILADFIDYLGLIDVRFGKYPVRCEAASEGDESCEEEHPFREHGDYFHCDPENLLPVGGESVFSKWIAGFYGIDLRGVTCAAWSDEPVARPVAPVKVRTCRTGKNAVRCRCKVDEDNDCITCGERVWTYDDIPEHNCPEGFKQ
jgi:hypothetical protein